MPTASAIMFTTIVTPANPAFAAETDATCATQQSVQMHACKLCLTVTHASTFVFIKPAYVLQVTQEDINKVLLDLGACNCSMTAAGLLSTRIYGCNQKLS